MKKEKLSFQIIQTHWLCQGISRIQVAKKPWHNSHRHTKTSFLNQLHHAGPKTYWMIIKSLSKQSSNIPTLSCDDSLATNDYDKANCLNNQFYRQQFQSFIPPLSIVPQQGYKNPVDCPNVLLCTEDEAFELILGLWCTKSTGPDEISARMLNH